MRSSGYDVEAYSWAPDFRASPRLIETACLIADVPMPGVRSSEASPHFKPTRHVPVVGSGLTQSGRTGLSWGRRRV